MESKKLIEVKSSALELNKEETIDLIADLMLKKNLTSWNFERDHRRDGIKHIVNIIGSNKEKACLKFFESCMLPKEFDEVKLSAPFSSESLLPEFPLHIGRTMMNLLCDNAKLHWIYCLNMYRRTPCPFLEKKVDESNVIDVLEHVFRVECGP